MKIAVVIPAYNEALRIGKVLERLPKKIGEHDVFPIVVDDGSRDETSKIAKNFTDIRVIRHRTNLGKGAAAKTGCDAAYHLGFEIVVLIDADGQHKPEDIPRIIAPILAGEADLVVGTRTFSKDMPFTMRQGNRFFQVASKMLFQIQASDTQSGFRAFTHQAYPQIRWLASHYAMEMEMLILASLNRVQCKEVAIETIYLDNYKGTTVLDGLRIVRTLIKWKLPWYQESSSLESSLL